MRRSILFSIILIFCVSALAQQAVNQTDAQGRKQGFWQKRDETGKLMYQAMFKDDKPVGEMKRFHPNGAVKAILVFSEKSDSSAVQLFDEKGKLIAKGNYFGQKKTGEWSNFSEGRLVSTETYSDGMKNGISRRYYSTGELLDETTWRNDTQEGPYRAYDRQGNKYMEGMYKNGKINGWYISFYPNGEMETETFYKDNLRHGSSKTYDEEGNLRYTLEYDEGILLNPEALDSIEKLRLNELEKNKGKVIDPEQFIADPAQYIFQRGNQ